MSNRRKPKTPTPDYAWLLCPDCASTVRTEWPELPDRKVMDVVVVHSPSCPLWREPHPELAIRMLPKGMTQAEVEQHAAVVDEQGRQQ